MNNVMSNKNKLFSLQIKDCIMGVNENILFIFHQI